MEQQVVQGVQETSFFLFAYESIKYILSKNIEQKEQRAQIEELGYHLGERAANYLMTTKSIEQAQTSKINLELETMMKFIAKEVWIFITGSQMSGLKKNGKGVFIFEINDIKLHSCLLSEKGNLKDEKLNCIFWFLSGLFKGVINSFNFECTVTYDIKAQSELKDSHPYTVSIQILNLNIK